jgi:hypothetical protein
MYRDTPETVPVVKNRDCFFLTLDLSSSASDLHSRCEGFLSKGFSFYIFHTIFSSCGSKETFSIFLVSALSMQRTATRLGVFSVVREEMSKIFPVFTHTAESTKRAISSYGNILMGKDGATPEQIAKEQEHRKAYQEILAKKAQQEAAQRAAQKRHMTFFQRIQISLEDLKNSTSKKSGVVALVQHCAAAHAAEVAIEQGIDVKSVTIQLEHSTVAQGVTSDSKVVGYIDAPAASEEQVMAFAARLERVCPAARAMEGRIDWRQVSSKDAVDGTPSRASLGTRMTDKRDATNHERSESAAHTIQSDSPDVGPSASEKKKKPFKWQL